MKKQRFKRCKNCGHAIWKNDDLEPMEWRHVKLNRNCKNPEPFVSS